MYSLSLVPSYESYRLGVMICRPLRDDVVARAVFWISTILARFMTCYVGSFAVVGTFRLEGAFGICFACFATAFAARMASFSAFFRTAARSMRVAMRSAT